MSLFITFEGVEGSGKSTQAKMLYEWLVERPEPVLLTHEPGGTPLGERIADLLKWAGEVKISPLAEILLFNASRAELVSTVIHPHLKEGGIVICDRYADSTLAYQGYGRGIDLDVVRQADETGTLGLKPDLTVLLDVPADRGLRRKKGLTLDRFEREDGGFHERVRQGYLKLAAAAPDRWLVVDGSRSVEQVQQAIRDRVILLLGKSGHNGTFAAC